MQLTRYTDYALRVLIYLKAHAPEPASIPQIAEAYGISRHHLAKVTAHLTTAGWVHGARGRGGGLTLTDAALNVTVGDLVRRLEINQSVVECLGEHNTCPITPACGLKHALAGATEAFLAHLDAYTLGDLVRHRKRLQTLLTVSR